jgi:hypothetical protein
VYVQVDFAGATASVTLLEADDFRSLKIVAVGPRSDGASFASATAELGRTGDGAEFVYIDVATLERLAGSRAEDERWRVSFAAMLAYAAEHGWVDDSGAVRVHVEWAEQ